MDTKLKLKNFSKDVNINSDVLQELICTLSSMEIRGLFQLLCCANKDNVIVCNGKPANMKELSIALDESYDALRKVFPVLKREHIIEKATLSISDYSVFKSVYVLNPWICSSGNIVYLEILNLFKDSKWKNIVDHNKDSRNSFEYALWEENVKKRDNYQCVICGETLDSEIHHISPYSIDYKNRLNIKNGLCLCKKHHNSKVLGSFHNTYGTVNNTKEQLQEYINLERKKLGLSPISIDDITNK